MTQVRPRRFSILHRKAGKKHLQILHYVQDDKRCTQRDLKIRLPWKSRTSRKNEMPPEGGISQSRLSLRS